MRALPVVLMLLSGCFVARDTTPLEASSQCTACHGDVTRAGPSWSRSAPPRDHFGNTGVSWPGVGAHAMHVAASSTHGAVGCESCHVVPKTPGDRGHNDGVTDVLADAGYDVTARTCVNACHLEARPAWTRPRSESDTCGTCHGLPPPAPHPQATQCFGCHGEVMAPDGGFSHPELHVDGTTQLQDASCTTCHGQLEGAHAVHLAGGASTRPVPCQTCHEVPATVVTPRHPNGGPGEVKTAVQWNRATTTCTNGCHASPSPAWSAKNVNLSCTGCHGQPPAAPHPQVANCALCHANAGAGQLVIDRLLHVDGVVEVAVPATCESCHGSSTNAAPPADTQGRTSTSLVSVGAHQSHLISRGIARAVECTECHRVPSVVIGGEHLDGVVQVRFSGVAIANEAQPVWNGMTCSGSACHDIAHFTAAPGGGSITSPRWTIVDGSQAACGTCHGLPPPMPHVQQADCSTCHTNVTATFTFRRPELHIDGHVDFAVP